MTRPELVRQYRIYLECLRELRYKRVSLEYARYRGMVHGIGVALDYDYEDVEHDIAQTCIAGFEPMLAI